MIGASNADYEGKIIAQKSILYYKFTIHLLWWRFPLQGHTILQQCNGKNGDVLGFSLIHLFAGIVCSAPV